MLLTDKKEKETDSKRVMFKLVRMVGPCNEISVEIPGGGNPMDVAAHLQFMAQC